MDGDTAIRVAVLGPLRVTDHGGRDITPDGELQRRLLALLVLRRGTAVSGDEAVETLWPVRTPRDPAAALQTHVFRLRRGLPDRVLTSTGSSYRLDGERIRVDADDLARAVTTAMAVRASDPSTAARLLDDALGCWRGRPYPELADTDDGRIEADRLGEVRLRAREERAEAQLALGHAGELVSELASLVQENPLRERPRALLMAALAGAGRVVEALRVYDDFRRLIGDELGIEPSPALASQHVDLVRGVSPSSAGLPVSRLPVAATSLIGREELITSAASTAGEHRLVTMLGPGGVGKTRAVVEVARRLASLAPDRPVVLCELAGASEESAVEVVAAALGIDRRAEAGLSERIAGVLDDAALVLVLDNCEHVLDPIAELVERLLAGCPDVVVLATSRERLRVAGEHLCPVPPLPLTDANGPAVRLFIERAHAVCPGFDPDARALATIVEIVRRLDGLPLAIELAAARLHTLEVTEVAEGLDRRFRLLGSGSRTSARHRSLGAAVSWSYDLLDADLRRLFTEVSVFSSPFTAADATAVAALDGGEVTGELAALVERSLIARTVDGRYVMFETLRAYGLEQLLASGRSDVVGKRHARHLVRWGEEANRRLRGRASASVLGEFDTALAEMATALSWFIEHEEAEPAGRLLIALTDYGILRLRPDVLAWADRVIAIDAGDDSPVAATVWAISAFAAWMTGLLDETGVRAKRALAISEAVGGELPAMVADIVGDHALFEGRLDEAIAWFRRGRAISKDHAWSMMIGGTEVLALTYAGEPTASDAARALLAEAGDELTPHAAFAWYAAGEAELTADPDLARMRLARALELAELTGASFVTGVAGTSAASIEARLGDPVAAAQDYRRLIAHWQRAGVWSTQWTMLRSIAALLERLGRLREAAVLAGAVVTTPAGHRLFGEDESALGSLASRLRMALGDAAYEAAFREGAALDGDAAVAHTLRSL